MALCDFWLFLKFKRPLKECVILSMVGIGCSSLMYVIFIIDPINMIVEYNLQMRPHSFLLSVWMNSSIACFLKVYIFNITNPVEFLSGEEKLKVQEIGPYVYQERLVNDNVTFNDNGTLTYTPRRIVTYVPEMSVGDPTENIINVPNLSYLGSISSLNEKGFMLNYLFMKLTNLMNMNPILNISVYDYLWSYDDPLVKLANVIAPNYITFQKFGILDRFYDEGENIVTINIQNGPDMLKEKGRYFSIDKFNGSPRMPNLPYVEAEGNETRKENINCYTLQGATESHLFPMHLDKRATFRLFRKGFCGLPSIVWEKEVWMDNGLPGYLYTFSNDFLDPSNECVCSKATTCLKKGLLDVKLCSFDVPLAASFPHFLDADSSLLENVEGLKPDREKHGSYIILQQTLGVPLSCHARMQLNLIMPYSHYNSKIEAFNDMTIPLVWVDLYVTSLPTYLTILLKLALQIAPVAQTVLMYLLGIIGATTLLLSLLSIVWLLTHQRQQELRITRNNDNSDLRIPLLCIILSMVGIGCSCLTYIIYIIDPVNMILDYNLQMTRPSLLLSMWQKPSLNVYLDVYIFNISNSVEFLNGKEKLKVQEIGPYVYQEHVINDNVTFNDNGTLTYIPRRTLVFIPEMSVGDVAEDIVNVPNILYLGVSSALSDYGFMLSYPFTLLANLMKAKPILSISVHDYLWGYEDSMVTLANLVVPNFINFQKFGILDRIYDEGENNVTIFVQNKPDMLEEEGRYLSIDKYNSGPMLTLPDYVETEDNETRKENAICDRLQGSMENVIFPTNIDKRANFRVYRKGFCRTLLFEFTKEVWRDDGVSGYLYDMIDDFVNPPEQNPSNECFCRKRKICLKKGLYDATPCYYNMPMAVSLPHFLDGDPSLLENMEGLKPDREKHKTYMILQQRLGLPTSFHFRLQANLVMKRSRYSTKIAAFNDMTVPLAWVDMSLLSLPTYETILLKLAVQIGPIAQTVLMYLLGIIGATALVLSLISIVWLLTRQQQQEEEITGNNDNPDLRTPLYNVCVFICVVLGIVCSCLTYIIYKTDPVNMILEYNLQMTRPSLLLSMWQKPSLNVYLDVYIFNISNSVEFLNGKEKLKVQEIGPYVYQEHVINDNVTFNDNGTLTYTPRRTLVFIPEMSVGDVAEDIVNVPNIPYLGVSSALSDYGFMLSYPFTRLANLMKAKPILSISVHDYLWGYEDSMVTLANSVVPNFINFQKFGILDRIYDEGENNVTIFVQNKPDMLEEEGRYLSIDKYNSGPMLTLPDYVETEDNETRKENAICDRLQGSTENVIFPTNIDKRANFRVYRKGFCRTLLFEFTKEVWRDDGVSGYLYDMIDDFVNPPEQNPSNECFCRKRKICLKKGLYDATPCYYNMPMAVSLPHFLDGDPSLLENMEGLKPDREKHKTYMILQQRLGLPTSFHFRLQANLVMKRSRYSTKIAAFNDMTVPLAWVDLSLLSLPTYETILLKLAVQIGPIAQTVLMYLLGIIGATALVLSLISIVWLLTRQQQQEEEITGNNDNPDLRTPLYNVCVFICVVLGIVCSCLTYIIYKTDPVNMILEYNLQIMPHSFLFSVWKKPPIGAYLNVYIFNITNPIEFLNGKEKLKVQEIGPYVYQEYLVNDNITYNDNGTLTYSPRRTVVYVPEMSVNDPTKDIINVANIAYLGISSSLSDAGFMMNYPFIKFTNAINMKPILNISVYDYLWGYDDPLAKLFNTIAPKMFNSHKLGFLDKIYDEGEYIVTTILQKKDDMLEEKGRYFSIDKYNGSPGLAEWGYIETEGNKTRKENTICNTVQGAMEGLVFPTHLDKHAAFRLYRKALCQPVWITFTKEVWTDDGLPGYLYNLKDDFVNSADQNPNRECFCRKSCQKKGLFDVGPCYYNMPVVASLPHFLDADPSLLENVEGLKPDREKHETYIILQQRIGLLMSFHGRFQANLIMKRSRYNPKIAAFNDMTIPLAWFDLYSSPRPIYLTILLKMILQILPVAQTVLMYLLGIIGVTSVLLLIFIVWLLTHQQQQEEEITGNNGNPDFRIPLCNSQYTSTNILPIKKIEDKLFDR